MSTTPFRILSLNGGGGRALFQAQYLHSISDKVGSFWKDFDLIIGTSAGAIVAAALCVGKTPKEIADFLILLPRTFSRTHFGRAFALL
jgi:patatin-like phospholipase/acyl hydrolase